MKLTENQVTVISSLLTVLPMSDTVRRWEYKHDRHLVVDELLDLCKKMKIVVSKEHARMLRDTADRGRQ